MQKVFTEEFPVHSFQLDAGSRLRVSAALNLMQQVAGDHLEQDGLSYRLMRERGCVFLLTRVALWMPRLPGWGETVRISTRFVHTAGAEYIRNMRFCSAGGEVLTEARTFWVTADPATHRILRPGSPALDFIKMPETEDDPRPQRKVRRLHPDPARGLTPLGDRRVVYSDLDYNGHMNNAVYADIVCDFMPGGCLGKRLTFLQLEFLGEALAGETLHLSAGEESRGAAGHGLPGGCLPVIVGNTDAHRCFQAAFQTAQAAGPEEFGRPG